MLTDSRPDPAGQRTGRAAAWTAAVAGAAAGVLHVAAAYEHLDAGDLVVAFFLATALAQVGAAAWIAARAVAGIGQDSRFVLAALAVPVALLLLFVVVHTTGLLDGLTGHSGGAAGAHVGHSELGGSVPPDDRAVHVDESPVLGTTTVSVEVFAVLAMTALLPAGHRRRVADVLLVLAVALWLLWLGGVLR